MLTKAFGISPGFAWTKNTLKSAASSGFSSIEFYPHIPSVPDMEPLKNACDSIGLKVDAIVFNNRNLTSSDQEERRIAREQALISVRCAKIVGAKSVVFVPGTVRKFVPPEDVKKIAYEEIASLIPEAASSGVAIAVENSWNGFLMEPEEMARFIDGFCSPFVCSCLDIGNVYPKGNPILWIKTLGKRIKRIHLKDWSYLDEYFVGLGDGDIDWSSLTSALRDEDVSAHASAWYGLYDKGESIEAFGKRVDRILS